MSKRLILRLSDGQVNCALKFKTRIPDEGSIPLDRVKEVALGLFNDLQHLTLAECEHWVHGLRMWQEKG